MASLTRRGWWVLSVMPVSMCQTLLRIDVLCECRLRQGTICTHGVYIYIAQVFHCGAISVVGLPYREYTLYQ